MDFLNKFSLKGKTALVTGCKRGIGKGMAQPAGTKKVAGTGK